MLIENDRTRKYPDDEYYLLSGGPGGIYLADQIAQKMNIQESDVVLDIGSGHLISSIYLAKEYGCRVFAFDLWVEATTNWNTIKKYGIEDKIIPIHGNVYDLPFAYDYFDKMFAMGSYHYFGKNEAFTNMIIRYLKQGGILGIGGPTYVTDDRQKCYDIYSDDGENTWYESPSWWKKHLSKCKTLKVTYSDIAEKGYEMWEDVIKKTYELKMTPPWGWDTLDEIEIIKKDIEKLRSNHITIAEKL